MTIRSITFAILISIVCLLVIGGPIASALFESPLAAPSAPVATVAAASAPAGVPPFASKVSWIVLGAMLAAGIVLTVSRARPA